jgi:hypothetical protein
VTTGISQGIGLTGTDFTSSLARGFIRGGGVVTQRIRMAVYNEGKLDYAAIAADAFGNALGYSLTEQIGAHRVLTKDEQEDLRDSAMARSMGLPASRGGHAPVLSRTTASAQAISAENFHPQSSAKKFVMLKY